MKRLLNVRGLSVRYQPPGGSAAAALSDVRFDLAAGEVAGLLGESGSGKTTLALSLMRLLPPSAQLASGSIEFRGRELLSLSEKEMESIRGAEASLIFQEPGIALHPMLRVGDQVADVLRVHRGWPRARCREEALAALGRAGLEESGRCYSCYPHELSGGQRQRVLIALALACGPALVIADEPTASLDLTLQREILKLFKKLRSEMQLSVLWISHHPAVLAQIADQVLVMYAGQIVEEGPLREVFGNPLHPYTKALLEAQPPAPAEGAASPRHPLPAPTGEGWALARPPSGCAFEANCPDRMDICRIRAPAETRPAPSRSPLVPIAPIPFGAGRGNRGSGSESARAVRCFKYGG